MRSSEPGPDHSRSAWPAAGPLRACRLEDGPTARIELAYDRNSSRYREGDILCLNRGDPFALPRWMVTLDSDEETRLLVAPETPGINWGELQENSARLGIGPGPSRPQLVLPGRPGRGWRHRRGSAADPAAADGTRQAPDGCFPRPACSGHR